MMNHSNVEELPDQLLHYNDLHSHPVIVLNFNGEITYLNLAMRAQFPDLLSLGNKHPLLDGLMSTMASQIKHSNNTIIYVREVEYVNRVYEQQIFATLEMHSLFIYMDDITKTKAAETEINENTRRYLDDIENRNSQIQILKNKMLGMRNVYKRNIKNIYSSLQSAEIATWNWNMLNDVIIWDDLMPYLFGLKDKKLMHTFSSVMALIHPEDHEKINNGIEHAIRVTQFLDLTFRVVYDDGSVNHLAVRARTYLNSIGQPLTMSGVCFKVS